MSITNIMSSRVVSVHMDDSLATIQALFDATGFHHLLVVEDNQLVGVISDRDLLKALSPFLGSVVERARDQATLERKAHQIMSRKPICLREHSSIMDAIKLFNRNKISCIPIVNANNKPVGIVSWRDIMQYAEMLVNNKKSS